MKTHKNFLDWIWKIVGKRSRVCKEGRDILGATRESAEVRV